MTNKQYKVFKDEVEQAIQPNTDQYIWYAGYLWLQLTERQYNDIKALLMTKYAISKTQAQIPSGMILN